MWKVYCDNFLLYNPELEDYKIISPSLSLELNKTGSFTFTIYSNHPNYDKLEKLKSTIEVYQDDYLYFRGRILNDTVGFYNERQVSCEGELAFLVDSIQRPFNFPSNDTDSATPEAYLTFLINRHNAQVDSSHQFTLGTVTVTDPNNYIARSDTQYSTTWDLINQGLIDTHGGYLWVRHESGVNYLDYLSDFDTLSNQPVSFGKNLLDLSTERKGEEIATAIIPLGQQDQETEERVTISNLENEETSDICKSDDFVYSKAAESLYGSRIVKVVTWDDVTDASNLLIKAKAKLAELVSQPQTITLTAADLSAAEQDFNSFRLGTYVQTESAPHEDAHSLSSTYLVKSLLIALENPSENKLTVGSTVLTFTEENKRKQETDLKKVETNIEVSQSKAIADLEQRTDSAILQNSQSILSKVSDEYYTKNDTDSLVSSVSTELQQTSEAFEFRFNELTKDIDDVDAGADAKFAEIKSYIRLEDGSVIIGLADNSFRQIQSATKNSFYEGAVEVAYISNKKMYITDGEFTNSLQLGKFAWLPRSNGNLSFKKVVE